MMFSQSAPFWNKDSMEKLDDVIWCKVHKCLHAPVTDPFNYMFELRGVEPECGPDDWCDVYVDKK